MTATICSLSKQWYSKGLLLPFTAVETCKTYIYIANAVFYDIVISYGPVSFL